MKLSAQALYRLGGWCLALLITAFSLVPPDFRPESGTPHHFEHFAIFCATGATFDLGYSSNRRLPLAIVLVTFAGAIEFAQIFAVWPLSVLPSTVLGRSWMETQLLMVSCEGLDRRGRRRL